MADNSLLVSKYIQSILEESNEILDILYPEDAPHTTEEQQEGETGEAEPLETNEQEGETGEAEPLETNEQEGETGEAEPLETNEQEGETGEAEPLETNEQEEQEKESKIFPLLQPANLTFPFIVHARTGIEVHYTKDIEVIGAGWYNIVNYTVSCVSDDYVQCIELANAVRHAMETYRWKNNDIYIHPIQLLTVVEYTTETDVFVEELQFQFIVE